MDGKGLGDKQDVLTAVHVRCGDQGCMYYINVQGSAFTAASGGLTTSIMRFINMLPKSNIHIIF